MHYLVFATGAVGAYLGARLALSGQPTTFLAHPRIASALRKHGLSLFSAEEYIHLPALCIINRLDELHAKPDIIFLTVKAYDVPNAAEGIRGAFKEPPPIVCFTNGVGSDATLAAILGEQHVIPATLTTAVERTTTYSIRIERDRGIGLSGSHPLVPKLCQEMQHAGMLVRVYPIPERMKWSKLLINISSNATSAILGWTPWQVFDHPMLSLLEIEALREAVRVMRRLNIRPQNLPKVPVAFFSLGIFLPRGIFRRSLGRIVTSGRGAKEPSFHHDIGRGRSEVEWLNGAVVREGDKHGIAVPANRTLLEIMRALVQEGSLHAQYRDQPGKLIEAAAQYGVHGFQRYNAGKK
jgi:2-dehydropantoate 2-reductase